MACRSRGAARRRDPRRLQGRGPGDGRPGRPRRGAAHPARAGQLQGRLTGNRTGCVPLTPSGASSPACSLWVPPGRPGPDVGGPVPLRARRKTRFFEVLVQDMVLRVAGPEELYEQARASGMSFWEQLQAYSIRNPSFRTSKRPLRLPDDAPAPLRRMADLAAHAGVGPMFTFQGALTEFVGRALGRTESEVLVSSGGDHF